MGPKTVQPKLFVEQARLPARAPLSRPMQLHRVEPHLHTMRLRVLGQCPIGREQGELSVAASVFIEGFDLPTPSFMLAVIDLAEIQHWALHHFAAATSLVLDNVPIAMLFAVFEASIIAQEHAYQFSPNKIDEKVLGLHYRRFQNSPL